MKDVTLDKPIYCYHSFMLQFVNALSLSLERR